ncbi:TFIIB-related factor [Danaus plexippus plexippus]|uniref:TFIIB-related factor n=1 Tax=Danaus plexippus plexippus TaxID=278856 RepID=A0A212F8Z9_DANPL|nr:TFIIB-related factor [Danaus plexippus plexippus]
MCRDFYDPCLYIIRFASQLQFEEKQHEVSMTALRLVQRMKRDSIHSGRRPSGVCGAALLIAARLHDFSRTPTDVVRIVKIHETTLRKRLLEFGETPSSALTLDEFMTVDLEEEQDPPAFKIARRRDKDRLQKLMEEEDGERELTELQREIDAQLDKDKKRRKPTKMVAPILPASVDDDTSEDAEASRFATEDTLSLIGDIARDVQPTPDGANNDKLKLEKGLGPEIAFMGLNPPEERDKSKPESKQFTKDLQADELHLDDDDEQYLDSLIMTDEEARHKTLLWHNINAGYLKEQKIKEEIRAKEREEGKDKKKKTRGSYKKKVAITGATAGEAVGKMLAEKKMSSKINYDILKSLDHPGSPSVPPVNVVKAVEETSTIQPPILETVPPSPVPKKRKRKEKTAPSLAPATVSARPSQGEPSPAGPLQSPTEPLPSPADPLPSPAPETPAQNADDYEDDFEDPVDSREMSLAALLQNGNDDEYYDYEEY